MDVIVRDQEAYNEESKDVEDQDTVEDLLDGTWEGFSRVSGLSGSKADEFGAGEGEGGCDKDGTEAFESVVECSWVCPVETANIVMSRNASAAGDDAENANIYVSPRSKKGYMLGEGGILHEANNSNDLDQ